jgi:NAD(P)-dependent dehydrogenase (short-subunit alcohol dehydrogenase family)
MQLAQEGCDVAIAARTEGPLKEVAAEIAAATGRKIVPVVIDVTDLDSIKAGVAAAAEALGGLEILVNNAARVGFSLPDDFDTVSDDLLFGDFTEKTMGYFRCAREAVPHMKSAGWGRVINIGGVTVRTPNAYSTPARNAAMIVMAKAMSQSLAPFGITVNVVHPGVTVTERTVGRYDAIAAQNNISREAAMEEQAKRMNMSRLVTAGDLAHVVVFLASPIAFSVSGEAIAASGGWGAALSL